MGMPAEKTRRWTAREVRDLIDAAPLATFFARTFGEDAPGE